MDPAINGIVVGILVTDGFEQAELTEPKYALEKEGAITRIISDHPGMVTSVHHDQAGEVIPVDLTFDQDEAADFDAILLPGGAENAERIRNNPRAQAIVRGMQKSGKPIAAICHGSLLLVSAGLVQGRTLTSWPALQDEICQAGGNWVDQETVVDGNLVSSRQPSDLPAFNQKMIEVIAEHMHAKLKGTADEHAVGIASS